MHVVKLRKTKPERGHSNGWLGICGLLHACRSGALWMFAQLRAKICTEKEQTRTLLCIVRCDRSRVETHLKGVAPNHKYI